jgi:hypothetical protein
MRVQRYCIKAFWAMVLIGNLFWENGGFLFGRALSGRAIRYKSSRLRRCGLSTTIPHAKAVSNKT